MSNEKAGPRIEFDSTEPDLTECSGFEYRKWVERVVAEFASLGEEDFDGYEDLGGAAGLIFRSELDGVRSTLHTLGEVVEHAEAEQADAVREAVEALLFDPTALDERCRGTLLYLGQGSGDWDKQARQTWAGEEVDG